MDTADGKGRIMSIIIGADVVPVSSNMDLFKKGDVGSLAGKELCELLEQADYVICNLEVPLSDQVTPIDKYGPNLIAPTSCINGISALGINLATLANNHILDHGDQGLISTIRELSKAGISFVGAGNNLSEAKEPFYVSVQNKRYGIYACAEHEFSIATESTPGANPFDALESPDHISSMKNKCDYIIVLYHGGKEHYRYPSPYLQKVCRKMVERGADLVVCQHSHCIGCEEKYHDGTIVYGQGNFIFPQNDNEYWNTSLLIEVSQTGKINYIPITRTNCGARLADEKEKTRILEDFSLRSRRIRETGFVEKEYMEYAEKNANGYIKYFSVSHNSLLFRGLNKFTHYLPEKRIIHRYLRKKRTGLTNFIECEAHRELLITGLKNPDSK